MTWLWVAVVVAVLGAVIAMAAGRITGGAMPEVAPDRPAAQLSSAPLTDTDLAGVRFTQTLRGYAMDEVDDFIERVRAELASRPAHDAYPMTTSPAGLPAPVASPGTSPGALPAPAEIPVADDDPQS
jgi:DivIVA domain-containing protein